MSEMLTIADYVATHGIKMESVKIPFRMDSEGESATWHKLATHYACTLRRDGSTATVQAVYSMGSAQKTPPAALDVFDCLISDATSAEEDFEVWCGEEGSDPDSRKALATYEACRKNRRDLIRFLGLASYRIASGLERL